MYTGDNQCRKWVETPSKNKLFPLPRGSRRRICPESTRKRVDLTPAFLALSPLPPTGTREQAGHPPVGRDPEVHALGNMYDPSTWGKLTVIFQISFFLQVTSKNVLRQSTQLVPGNIHVIELLLIRFVTCPSQGLTAMVVIQTNVWQQLTWNLLVLWSVLSARSLGRPWSGGWE